MGSRAEILIPHGLVMLDREVFGKVIGKVLAAEFPEDTELVLMDTVLQPIESHVNGFGAALFYCVITNAGGRVVVGL